jgi:excinuclease ABC subunit B
VNAKVILYADTVTNSMQRAIDETNRRRKLQIAYNAEHGITPETIRKAIRKGIEEEIQARRVEREMVGVTSESQFVTQEFLRELESEMLAAAEQLDFERAAHLRDRIHELKKKMGQPIPDDEGSTEPGFASKGKATKKGGRKRR